jgi:hypothetical protein
VNRGRKRVVDEDESAGFVRCGDAGSQVGDLEERIGRGLQPQQADATAPVSSASTMRSPIRPIPASSRSRTATPVYAALGATTSPPMGTRSIIALAAAIPDE